MEEHEAPVLVVAGGNHVIVIVDASKTDGAFDVIEVLAAPGGGPPPHQHVFTEWFHVLDGELQLTGVQDGEIVPTRLLQAGETARVDAWKWHGTRNETEGTVRFVVVGQPGLMTTYLARAGVPVGGIGVAADRQPPGRAQLAEIAAECGIRFWPPA